MTDMTDLIVPQEHTVKGQLSTDELTQLQSQLQAAIGDTSGVLFNSPEAGADAAPEHPLEDCMLPDAAPEDMTVEELTQSIGALRAARDRADMAPKTVADRPQTAVSTLANRQTTSRDSTWCKVQQDGFTPTRQPAMRIQTVYDTATTVPHQRSWTFLDPFQKKDEVIENWTVKYPLENPERVARDITRAWQVYSTPSLELMDAALLANTPLAVEVDGIRGRRYLDIWMELRRRYNEQLPSSVRWRVIRGEIRNDLKK